MGAFKRLTSDYSAHGFKVPSGEAPSIRDIIESQSFTNQITEEAEYAKLTRINIHRNLRQFGSIYAPQTRIGQKFTMTSLMIEALYDYLSQTPGFYLDEMTLFLWDELQALVTTSSIRRALVAKFWSKKTAR
ncbi:hypothetical protein N7462_006912 [Penicillium macrosclerotiorum]|uniref:uncharacterized protein n=1 Tax=Penicillium macrosclerotiorum TaxID=303699 RepID=UPI002547BEF1|nr:uncharacterized protein N7462_006912 [Penicillium macrosclerotiorum]KAJ5678668.1 hypothetical protein N7462_006912 [Penicillium macrosclerotiorum]